MPPVPIVIPVEANNKVTSSRVATATQTITCSKVGNYYTIMKVACTLYPAGMVFSHS